MSKWLTNLQLIRMYVDSCCILLLASLFSLMSSSSYCFSSLFIRKAEQELTFFMLDSLIRICAKMRTKHVYSLWQYASFVIQFQLSLYYEEYQLTPFHIFPSSRLIYLFHIAFLFSTSLRADEYCKIKYFYSH